MKNTLIPSSQKPDFIIIGAMKCATSTLHDQLASQPGFFMSTPKEPNFFSDNDVFAKGLNWYTSLFEQAKSNDLKGESSTHYTKQPTYPETINRLKVHLPQIKLIYVMRHPVDRLISHYIHEWTQGVISCGINRAIHEFPELIAFSCYNRQLEPYLKSYSPEQILPLFAERLRTNPLPELQTIFKFLNVKSVPFWQENIISNVSAKRLRVCGWRDTIVENPIARIIRRTFIPKSLRSKIKSLWLMQTRPELSPENLQHLEKIFDKDLQQLGNKLGLKLTCHNFKQTIGEQPHFSWVNCP